MCGDGQTGTANSASKLLMNETLRATDSSHCRHCQGGYMIRNGAKPLNEIILATTLS